MPSMEAVLMYGMCIAGWMLFFLWLRVNLDFTCFRRSKRRSGLRFVEMLLDFRTVHGVLGLSSGQCDSFRSY